MEYEGSCGLISVNFWQVRAPRSVRRIPETIGTLKCRQSSLVVFVMPVVRRRVRRVS